MIDEKGLEENTKLTNKCFPFNIFDKSYTYDTNNILYLHWHANIEIIYLIEGNAIFDIGNKSIEALPGDIIFVNSKQLHTGFSINNTNIKYHSIVFNKSLIQNNIFDQFYNKYIAPFMEDKILFPNKINTSTANYYILKGYIENIILEFNNKQAGYEIMIKNYINSIILFIIRNNNFLSNNLTSNQVFINTEKQFEDLFKYVSENYPKKMSINEAASIVNLSPYYFCRTFKKLTGKTFTQFVNLYRINMAEYLLRSTNMSVTEIAEKTGFCNLNYFSKIYKDFKKYPPTDCRKNNINN